MTKSIDRRAADAATSAHFGSIAKLVSLLPGARLQRAAHGTHLMITTIPLPALNGVCVDHELDLDEVESFAKEMSAVDVPWSIQVRGEVDPAVTRLAERYGKTTVQSLPLLVWDTESLPRLTTGIPENATVRNVPGAQADLFAAALAAGFEMPREVADSLAQPAFLDEPGMTGFVLDVHGEAVATGFNVLVGDQVALYNGSVPPQHRRKGYYRALVTARLRDAVDSGARHAFSLNTPMSRPLYESLGFRVVETWTYLTSEADSGS